MSESGTRRYALFAPGDGSAFLGLTFDNVAQLILFSGILIGVFGFPAGLVLGKMLPGTALGVFFGDLIYTWLALRLSREEGRQDVTAMPLGIDTPSLFGLTFGVLGPVYLKTHDAELSWQVGMALMVVMGLTKVALSFVAKRLLMVLPPAALFGTIGGVGVLLIAFFPLLKILSDPLVGLPALLLVLYVLLRRVKLPYGIPPVLLVVIFATLLSYLVSGLHGGHPRTPPQGLMLNLPLPSLGFLKGLSLAWSYLPVALPLALITVIGGIDTAASAAAAGDRYDTRDILLTEGVSTLAAAFFGGVIQTTPYIGHPAYKNMGARAGYTLLTALFIGLGGVFGYLSYLIYLLPEAAVGPILIFIGLEIAGLSFRLVEEKQAPAVALCFLPVIANLAFILVGQTLSGASASPDAIKGPGAETYQALRLLSNGFVFSSLLLGTAGSSLIDGKLRKAALFMTVSSIAALFGLVHASAADGGAHLPWNLSQANLQITLQIAGGYGIAALALFLLSFAKSADS